MYSIEIYEAYCPLCGKELKWQGGTPEPWACSDCEQNFDDNEVIKNQ